ncbi:hypothetical protein, partial [Pseudomonas inefficax]|uniref:hypothetical protein n=1 Tax=Pseudomonas inefficax TaxID=2078786 RepID=UPI0032653344
MELLLGTEKKTSERYARGAVKASRPSVWALETHGYGALFQLEVILWERVHPRSRRRDGWHRLRR